MKTRIPRGASCFLLGVASLFTCSSAASYEILGARWSEHPVPFRINPNFPDPSVSGTAEEQIEIIRCAADGWTSQTSAEFSFLYEGTTIVSQLSSFDGVNAVFWSSVESNDALAATILSSQGTEARAFDVVFFSSSSDSEYMWSGPGEPASGEFDIGGVAAHEFGHALGLNHTFIQEATMFGFGPAHGGRTHMRTLHQDDIDGSEFLYGRQEHEPSVKLDTVSPPQGPVTGGNAVLISGVNFTYTTDTEVRVGGEMLGPTAYYVESCSRLWITSMPPHTPGGVSIEVVNTLGRVSMEAAYLYVDSGSDFVRGDANLDGIVDLGDAVRTLNALFQGGAPLACQDAADGNDDGAVNITDPVYVLQHLFQGGAAPPAPYPEAGLDPTADALSCPVF